MLNRGYAYSTTISSKYHGQTLLSHLASLYHHSTPQAWQQKLDHGEVTLNGVTATGSESVTLGQTLVWNRPPWIEPGSGRQRSTPSAPDGSVWGLVTSFVQCCVNVHSQVIHLDANGARLLAQVPIDVADMVVDNAGNLIAHEFSPITVSSDAFLTNDCGASGYVKLSPTGQQLFATYLGVDDAGDFDGADAQGTPYMDSSTGRIQIVENQNMGPYAGCVVDAAGFKIR